MAYKGVSVADDPIHFRTNTLVQVAPPVSNGDIIWDDVVQGESTKIWISETTSDGIDITGIREIISVGSSITLIDDEYLGTYQQWIVDDIISHNEYLEIKVTLADGFTNNFVNDRKVRFIASNAGAVPPALFTEGRGLMASDLMRIIMLNKGVGDAMIINADKTGFDFLDTVAFGSPLGTIIQSVLVPVEFMAAFPNANGYWHECNGGGIAGSRLAILTGEVIAPVLPGDPSYLTNYIKIN